MFKFRIRDLLWLTVVALGVFLCPPGVSSAIGEKIWTYKSLTKESDFVCIGMIEATVKRENKDFLPEFLDELESDIRIRAVMKGDASLERIVFRHFTYKPGAGGLGNGPTFPDIDYQVQGALNRAKAQARTSGGRRKDGFYLFFLKRREDGRYEPVSGNDDAGVSVARVQGKADEE